MLLSNKSDNMSWAHRLKDFNYQLPILITNYQFNCPVQKFPFSYTKSSFSLLSLTFSLCVLWCSPLIQNASVTLIVWCPLQIHSNLTVNATFHTPKWGGITYSQCVSQKKKNGELFRGAYLVCWLERELISNLKLYIQQVLDFINAENLSTKLHITSEKIIILKYSKLCYTDVLNSSPIHATLVYEKHIIL